MQLTLKDLRSPDRPAVILDWNIGSVLVGDSIIVSRVNTIAAMAKQDGLIVLDDYADAFEMTDPFSEPSQLAAVLAYCQLEADELPKLQRSKAHPVKPVAVLY